MLPRVAAAASPYLRLARLDKPVGTLLLLSPCLWSTSLASGAGHLPDPSLLALLGAGALLMRGAGCTINDMWDRRLDATVARTVQRPLASDAIPLFPHATLFLSAQLAASLAVLCSLPHLPALLPLALSSLPLVATYPLAKRWLPLPQLALGLTFNWGAFVGGAAVLGAVPWQVSLPLYAGGVAWTVFYDTVYAHQDKEDDARAGMHSGALLFGERTKGWLLGFAGLAVAGWDAAGCQAGLAHSLLFHGGMLSVLGLLAAQLWAVDLDSAPSCWRTFDQSKWMGLYVWALMTAGMYFWAEKEEEDPPPREKRR